MPTFAETAPAQNADEAATHGHGHGAERGGADAARSAVGLNFITDQKCHQ